MALGLVVLVTVTGCGHQDNHTQDGHIPISAPNPQVYTPDQAMAMVKKFHEKNSGDKITVSCTGDFNGEYHVTWKDTANSKTGMDYVNDQTGKITAAQQK